MIDDVGWWCGQNGSTRGEPYRTGITRDHVPADYEAIISLGRQLGMKPQAAMILCEWDKTNILRALPSATWMGDNWDNSRWVGPWQDEAAEIIRQGRDHFELTLHGIGHEYWQVSPQGNWEFTRAEWHDSAGNMRPRDEVLARLEYFQKVLDQHNLGPFPTSFVPCAFLHRFRAEQQDGLAAILKQAGIRFISTPYQTMYGTEYVQHDVFGFDNGIMTVDRGHDMQRWLSIGESPQGELSGAICGMHWPNILHEDPSRNEEVVSAWVDFLRPYNKRVDRLLAPDTATFATQLAHHTCTTYAMNGNSVDFDFTDFYRLPQDVFNDSLHVKFFTPRSTPALLFTTSGAEIVATEEATDEEGVLYTVILQLSNNLSHVRLEWRSE